MSKGKELVGLALLRELPEDGTFSVKIAARVLMRCEPHVRRLCEGPKPKLGHFRLMGREIWFTKAHLTAAFHFMKAHTK